METTRRLIAFTTALTLAAMALVYADSSETLDLKSLEGDWEGNGEFLMPVTSMKLSLKGEARFDYDSTSQRLRTSLTGRKLFFAYSDSGYLDLDQTTDSISWEVWDNFGRHAKYYGTVEGNKVAGERFKKKDIYRVMIELVTPDSIDFKLTITKPDGDRIDKATFYLWRVKE